MLLISRLLSDYQVQEFDFNAISLYQECTHEKTRKSFYYLSFLRASECSGLYIQINRLLVVHRSRIILRIRSGFFLDWENLLRLSRHLWTNISKILPYYRIHIGTQLKCINGAQWRIGNFLHVPQPTPSSSMTVCIFSCNWTSFVSWTPSRCCITTTKSTTIKRIVVFDFFLVLYGYTPGDWTEPLNFFFQWVKVLSTWPFWKLVISFCIHVCFWRIILLRFRGKGNYKFNVFHAFHTV